MRWSVAEIPEVERNEIELCLLLSRQHCRDSLEICPSTLKEKESILDKRTSKSFWPAPVKPLESDMEPRRNFLNVGDQSTSTGDASSLPESWKTGNRENCFTNVTVCKGQAPICVSPVLELLNRVEENV